MALQSRLPHSIDSIVVRTFPETTTTKQGLLLSAKVVLF